MQDHLWLAMCVSQLLATRLVCPVNRLISIDVNMRIIAVRLALTPCSMCTLIDQEA